MPHARPALPFVAVAALLTGASCHLIDASKLQKFGCDAGRCLGDGPPAEGESCAQPVPLTATGVISVSGTTYQRRNDSSADCGGAGPDAVYTFTVPQPGPVAMRATLAAGAAAQPVLYLRGPGSTECPAGPPGVCSTAVRGVAEVRAGALDAGTWALWVDNAGGDGDAYDLTLSFGGVPVPGDTCANPIALGELAAGRTTAIGTTAGAEADAIGSCANTNAADIVYSFSVPTAGHLTAVVTPGLDSLLPVAYLRTDCGSTVDIICAAASAPGLEATLSVAVNAGTYYLWVDGPGSSNVGSHTLDLTFQ